MAVSCPSVVRLLFVSKTNNKRTTDGHQLYKRLSYQSFGCSRPGKTTLQRYEISATYASADALKSEICRYKGGNQSLRRGRQCCGGPFFQHSVRLDPMSGYCHRLVQRPQVGLPAVHLGREPLDERLGAGHRRTLHHAPRLGVGEWGVKIFFYYIVQYIYRK